MLTITTETRRFVLKENEEQRHGKEPNHQGGYPPLERYHKHDETTGSSSTLGILIPGDLHHKD